MFFTSSFFICPILFGESSQFDTYFLKWFQSTNQHILVSFLAEIDHVLSWTRVTLRLDASRSHPSSRTGSKASSMKG